MKNLFKTYIKYTTLTLTSLSVIMSSSAFAQNAPVGMRYVGSQNYGGTTTAMMPQQQTAPVINSVYAQPMRRINEVPIYGKNKGAYIYDHRNKTEDTNPFADSGLYMFAGFSMGTTSSGLNSEKPTFDGDFYLGGSDASSSMGDVNGLTFGVGRVMSNTLSVEFTYSQYSGMNYGDYASIYYPEYIEDTDLDGNPLPEEDIYIEEAYVDDFTFEVLDGGEISSEFIGIGLKYNLENMFGTVLGMFKPYLGVHIGITQNTIDDYTISDPFTTYGGNVSVFAGEVTTEMIEDVWIDADNNENSALKTGYKEIIETSDLNYRILGSTTQSFGAGIEIGATMLLGGNLEMDIFYKYNTFGTIETSGSSLLSYYEFGQEYYIINDTDGETCPDGYSQSTSPVPGAGTSEYFICIPTGTGDGSFEGEVQEFSAELKETGDVNFTEFGLKFKYLF